MKLGKLIWQLALALLLVACSTKATPTSSGVSPQPVATSLRQGYPASETVATPQEAYPAPNETAGGTATMTYQDFEIVPAEIMIKAGTTVTFLIKGGPHRPYTSDPAPAFEAGPDLHDGAIFQVTFTRPGTFTLRCGYHDNMKATVVVNP